LWARITGGADWFSSAHRLKQADVPRLENMPYWCEAKANEFFVDGQRLIAHQDRMWFPSAGTFLEEFYNSIHHSLDEFSIPDLDRRQPQIRLRTLYIGGTASAFFFGRDSEKKMAVAGHPWEKTRGAPFRNRSARAGRMRGGDSDRLPQGLRSTGCRPRQLDSMTMEQHLMERRPQRETVATFLSLLAARIGVGGCPLRLCRLRRRRIRRGLSKGPKCFPAGRRVARQIVKALVPAALRALPKWRRLSRQG